MKIFITLFVLFMAISGLIASIVFVSHFESYKLCLDSDKISNEECFKNFIMLAPPVQEAQELQKACDNPDSDCYIKLGQMAIEEKLTS